MPQIFCRVRLNQNQSTAILGTYLFLDKSHLFVVVIVVAVAVLLEGEVLCCEHSVFFVASRFSCGVRD